MSDEKPGWRDYVEELHAEARKAVRVESERETHNKHKNANFKSALLFIKKVETLRSLTHFFIMIFGNTMSNILAKHPYHQKLINDPDTITQLPTVL